MQTAERLNSEVINGLALAAQKVIALIHNNPASQQQKNTDNADSDHHKTLKALTDLIKQIKKNTEKIANELHPEILVKEGIYVAIDQMANEISAKSNIKIKVAVVNTADRPPVEVETIGYRIVQEALENILLHSKATEASIRLRQSRHVLSITIQDNGVGFDPGAAAIYLNQRGIGLSDMQLQTELLHGSFTLFSSEGTGTMIKVALPLSIR